MITVVSHATFESNGGIFSEKLGFNHDFKKIMGPHVSLNTPVLR